MGIQNLGVGTSSLEQNMTRKLNETLSEPFKVASKKPMNPQTSLSNTLDGLI